MACGDVSPLLIGRRVVPSHSGVAPPHSKTLGKNKKPGYSRLAMNAVSTHRSHHSAAAAFVAGARTSLLFLQSLRLLP